MYKRQVRVRWDQHYENRKCRFSRTADGVRTAWFEFDDDSAAFVDQLVGAGMRPRRGGPRMVDPADAERAQHLIDDPRSN
ncbi:HNH endonuclease, partial [Mycetocola zhadangensis]